MAGKSVAREVEVIDFSCLFLSKKEKMPKYSIITPEYNSFNLMERYFDSLENQTFMDFEIVIVDDCSTDDSYEKLQEYARKSPLSITLKQSEKNFGPGNTRNIGLDNATGEWVTFIDIDARCDLHPYRRQDGKAICFDSVFEGHRGLYIVNLDYHSGE